MITRAGSGKVNKEPSGQHRLSEWWELCEVTAERIEQAYVVAVAEEDEEALAGESKHLVVMELR